MPEKKSTQAKSFPGCIQLGVLQKLQIQLTNSSSWQSKAAFVCAISPVPTYSFINMKGPFIILNR